MIMILFGAILIRLRKKAALSQQHVADHLGIVKSTYNNWESDKRAFTADFLPKLAEVFGVEVVDLLPPGLVVKIAKADGQRDGIALDAKQLYEDLVGFQRDKIQVLEERVRELEAEIQRLRKL
jgi:transcriptional regulator with XRE-family HTH domain